MQAFHELAPARRHHELGEGFTVPCRPWPYPALGLTFFVVCLARKSFPKKSIYLEVSSPAPSPAQEPLRGEARQTGDA